MSVDYLKAILLSTGDEQQITDVSAKISEIVQQITVLKNDVQNVIEDRSLNFQPYLKENETLKKKVQRFTDEVTIAQTSMTETLKPKLLACRTELETMSSSMRELTCTVDILTRLQQAKSVLDKAGDELAAKEFYLCAQSVSSLQEFLKENAQLGKIDVFRLLSQEVVLLYEQLLFTMTEVWSSCVILNTSSDSARIEVNVATQSFMHDIIKATYLLNDNIIERRFSRKLMQDIMQPIIVQETRVSRNEDEERAVLLVELRSRGKPHYVTVFENITAVVQFMKDNMDVRLRDDVSFVSHVGKNTREEFMKILLENCLAETIPSRLDDLENYTDILSAAATFQTGLQAAGFLPSDCTSIIDYANNINVLFANKCCQSYLNRARQLMKQDLHTMVPSQDITLSGLTQLPESVVKLLKEKLNCTQETTLSFLKCQISKSAEDLLKLVDDILAEVVKSQDLCAVRLFYTVRNIFEMYSAVVPLHHNKFLETIPQQVAIFHNNCLYFTYCLVQLACDYKHKLPPVLKDHCVILIDEAVVLRRLGTETLESQVSSQRNQIIYILRDSGLATLNEDPKLHPNSEKSVRQCLRQLQILQTVWGEVLPVRVYNNAMGFLVDALVEELASLVLAVEDISSDTASELCSIFTMVQERAPNLFPEPKQVHRFSRKWQRFKELTLVLGGSLKDITERWADGVGPLAYEFTADQVKHLIRALFQNTERRAAILVKIK